MNIGKLADNSSASVGNILKFTQLVTADETLVDEHEIWCFDFAIIRLCREFENFMLHCLIGLINNDSSTLSSKTGIEFPQHMKVEICEYLVRGDSYFDFRGRSGLIKKIKQFVPSKPDHDDDHWFLKIVKECDKNSLNQLIALRNFAAHNSPHAKKSALESTGQRNMSSSGAWLKIQETDRNRFTKICESLKRMAKEIKNMAKEIENQAPY